MDPLQDEGLKQIKQNLGRVVIIHGKPDPFSSSLFKESMISLNHLVGEGILLIVGIMEMVMFLLFILLLVHLRVWMGLWIGPLSTL